jgi:hypothetical protein
MTEEDQQATDDRLEVALLQYQEIREEIGRFTQAKTAVLGLALTATAAIGGLGLGSSQNRELLLVLPFVLSGLAWVYLHYAVVVKTTGDYIRTRLWPFLGRLLPPPGGDQSLLVPCWETWIDRKRRGTLFTLPGLVTFVGQGIIFAAPGAGALALTCDLAWDHVWAATWWIWIIGFLTLGLTTLMAFKVERWIRDTPEGEVAS